MNVLVVDDDSAIVEVICQTVNWKKLGITEVFSANDAKSAMPILEAQKIDLVISDIEMPGISGLDLLSWYREKGYDGKFLLLTSYESFSYATKALQLHAAEYLLKPFHLETMEMVLKKNLTELEQERRKNKAAEYGDWILENMKEMKLSFLQSLLSGKIRPEMETIEKNLQIRNIPMKTTEKYRFVVSSVTNMEQDKEDFDIPLLRFMLTELHAKVLRDKEENEDTVLYELKKEFVLITICPDQPDEELKKRCDRLICEGGTFLESTITCCISEPVRMDEFLSTGLRLRQIQERNVIYYGETYFARNAILPENHEASVLDETKMKEFLEKKDKKGLLEYLRREMAVRIHRKSMDEKLLQIIRTEFRQAVYVYFASHGLQLSQISNNPVMLDMSEKSVRSVMDMLRWANYLLEEISAYEKNIQSADSLIDQIQFYIREHYAEELGRNELGRVFHLAPEYLARIYKKKTSQTLKDYINQYRIEQAIYMLGQTEKKVSDIAMDVGFDNISYFSTLFKKQTGISPHDYRKKITQNL